MAEALALREGRSEPNLEDSLAAAILEQIAQEMRVEWRSADDQSPIEELIRNHFSSLRRLINR